MGTKWTLRKKLTYLPPTLDSIKLHNCRQNEMDCNDVGDPLNGEWTNLLKVLVLIPSLLPKFRVDLLNDQDWGKLQEHLVDETVEGTAGGLWRSHSVRVADEESRLFDVNDAVWEKSSLLLMLFGKKIN